MEDLLLQQPAVSGDDCYCTIAVRDIAADIIRKAPPGYYFPDIHVFSGNIHCELTAFIRQRKITPGQRIVIVAPLHYYSLFWGLSGLEWAGFIDISLSLVVFREHLRRYLLSPVAMRTPAAWPSAEPFRPRGVQARVLDLIRRGFTVGQIVNMTGLGFQSISRHKRMAMAALGVHSTQALLLKLSIWNEMNQYE